MAGVRTATDLLTLQVPHARPTRSADGATHQTIRLRGVSSFTQSVEPLILIDGVVVSHMQRALEILERIAASDVREIEVLWGPAAASRYPWAASGVVHVRTNTGPRSW